MKQQDQIYVIVGAGFFGATIAEQIAANKNGHVIVIESRSHLGGASYSAVDEETGIEHHLYGSHIFHTNNKEVWDYINRFSSFNHYRHKVLTLWKSQIFPVPINLDTICRFYGRLMSPSEAMALLQSEAAKEKITTPTNLEEKAISQIGRPLYEALIKGYTAKQWGTHPKKLPASIIKRLPVRTNYDGQYFEDIYQGIPTSGYGKLFETMLDHPLIELRLNTDFFNVKEQLPAAATIIYTGPIDQLFDYRFGPLSWRSLHFEHERIFLNDFQGCSVMNYAEASVPYTRIHEFKHYHPERTHRNDVTLITREYPTSFTGKNSPYYPVNTLEDNHRLTLYQEAARQMPNLIIGGRLGSYRYYNMDQTIAKALDCYDRYIKHRETHA